MKRRFQTLSADGPDGKQNDAETPNVRRTETTVEREWVTEIWRVAAEGGLKKVYEDLGTPELEPPKPPEK